MRHQTFFFAFAGMTGSASGGKEVGMLFGRFAVVSSVT
jgi:hypothetical protein